MHSYANVFSYWINHAAEESVTLWPCTPAMEEALDLLNLRGFPDRFFDVGIAEQHWVTLAAGLASEWTTFIVAIYSTFLQRAYDQLIHDVNPSRN